MKPHRIMIIGNHIAIVQKLSRYCLDRGAEVLPYYGIPTNEEIALFAPEVAIVCLPIERGFLDRIAQPYLLWSEEKTTQVEHPFVDTFARLQTCLQQILPA